MRLTAFGLLMLGLLAVPSGASTEPDAANPSPELIRLDRKLTLAQQARPENAPEFLTRLRADLDAAMSDVSPSPENTALHARILVRLGDLMGEALKQDSKNAALRLGLSQVRFDEKNYPAALAEANAVLERDPANKEALVLKYFSEGRVAMSGEAADNHLPPSARRFHFTAAAPTTLPFKLPVKISPAAAPPDLSARGTAPAAPGPLPLLPLAGAAALGLAAYEISRSRAAYESADGLDDEHPKPVGFYQRLVAGAILAGAAGAVIYTLGAAVVSAAPVAFNYATNFGDQGLRLANSEVGAINPGELKTANGLPKMLARVIPYEPGTTIPEMIGRSDRSHAFVTAAEDISGISASGMPQRLGIAPSQQYLVIRFPTPSVGISTPLTFDHPLFVGRGLTSGGAREFFVTNDLIPSMATYEVIK